MTMRLRVVVVGASIVLISAARFFGFGNGMPRSAEAARPVVIEAQRPSASKSSRAPIAPDATQPSSPVLTASPEKPDALSNAPATQPDAGNSPINPAMLAAFAKAKARQSNQASAILGGAFAQNPFQEIPSQGALLIGFRVGLGKFFDNDIVVFLQPIYLTKDGEVLGKAHGGDAYRTVKMKAPSGYAVGKVSIRGGGSIDAITLTYYRIDGTRLDPDDAMVTNRVGGPGGSEHFSGATERRLLGYAGEKTKTTNGWDWAWCS